MRKEISENDKKFFKWLEQFIKKSGHSWGVGFFVELHTGEMFYNGTPDYTEWYNEKLDEYNQLSNKE